jgi:hypothetical protein
LLFIFFKNNYPDLKKLESTLALCSVVAAAVAALAAVAAAASGIEASLVPRGWNH